MYEIYRYNTTHLSIIQVKGDDDNNNGYLLHSHSLSFTHTHMRQQVIRTKFVINLTEKKKIQNGKIKHKHHHRVLLTHTQTHL